MEELPLVLDWVIGEETCEIAKRNSTTYVCKSNNSDCLDNSISYRCSCMQGYDGNPYLKDGCQGFAFMVIIVFGWSYTAFQRRKMLMCFPRKWWISSTRGRAGSSNTNTVKIFTAEELEKATNDFDKDRVVGQGGYGSVYKG
ncbi:hypothetical protein MTR67_038550 [Solanum verrucosum]|uniref:Uncharacterized protein n=1 Tax=Solanum verrucosum TaxID=315347 RepID=A0AAF0UG67_SOLVR|nr:hypothetical protein MTR67_038550 [Solanum verrucosum]